MKIEYLHYKLDRNLKVKRIYGCSDEREASRFAHLFGGIHYEYLPNYYRIVI